MVHTGEPVLGFDEMKEISEYTSTISTVVHIQCKKQSNAVMQRNVNTELQNRIYCSVRENLNNDDKYTTHVSLAPGKSCDR